MDKLDASFDRIMEQYFQTVSKKNSRTIESKLATLIGLKKDLSPRILLASCVSFGIIVTLYLRPWNSKDT